MKIRDWQSLIAEIGGRRFLEPNFYLLIAAAIALVGSLVGTDFKDINSFFLYVLANLTSIVTTSSVLMLIRSIKLRRHLHFNFGAIVGVGMLAGSVKGASTAFFVQFLGLEVLASALKTRLLPGVFAGIAIVVLVAVLPVLVNRFETERMTLVRTVVTAGIKSTIEPIVQDISNQIEALRSKEQTQSDARLELTRISESLLRPKLMELWGSSIERYPSFKPLAMVSYAFRKAPIPVYPFLALVAFGSLFRLDAAQFGVMTFVIFFGNLALIAMSLLIANQQKKRHRPELAFFISVAIPSTSFTAIFAISNPTASIVSLVVNFSLSVVLTTIFSISTALLAAGFGFKARQEADLNELAVNKGQFSYKDLAETLSTRRSAEIIHGQIQSLVLATSIRIGLDPGQQQAELQLLSERLRALESQVQPQEVTSFIRNLQNDWSQVMELKFEVSGEIQELDVPLQEVIREGVTNAHKHGFAQNVKIAIKRRSQNTQIEIVDDGLGPQNGPIGMGTMLLGLFSTWSLSKNPQVGSTLKVRISGQ